MKASLLCRKDIEHYCVYCEFAQMISENEAVCQKKGVVALSYSCSRFKYDPLKRVPPKPARLNRSLITYDLSI